jgi:hypothetical protein
LYAGTDRGKIELDAASVPHDKCQENYAATYVTQQKTTVLSARQILKTLRGKKKKGVEKPQAKNVTRHKKKQRRINQRYKIGARK